MDLLLLKCRHFALICPIGKSNEAMKGSVYFFRVPAGIGAKC